MSVALDLFLAKTFTKLCARLLLFVCDLDGSRFSSMASRDWPAKTTLIKRTVTTI